MLFRPVKIFQTFLFLLFSIKQTCLLLNLYPILQQRDSESSNPFALNLESSGLKAPNPKHFANALVDNTQVASKMLQEMDCFKFIDELVALNVDEKTKGNDQTAENFNSYCKSNDFESFKPPILSNSERASNSMHGHNIPPNFHQNPNNVQSLNVILD